MRNVRKNKVRNNDIYYQYVWLQEGKYRANGTTSYVKTCKTYKHDMNRA